MGSTPSLTTGADRCWPVAARNSITGDRVPDQPNSRVGPPLRLRRGRQAASDGRYGALREEESPSASRRGVLAWQSRPNATAGNSGNSISPRS